jgi:hypothetical protein
MPLKRRVIKELPKSLGIPERRHWKDEAVDSADMGSGGASSEHGPSHADEL